MARIGTIFCPTLLYLTFLIIFKEKTQTCQRSAIEIVIRENSEISSLTYHHPEKLARVENRFLMEIYDGKI